MADTLTASLNVSIGWNFYEQLDLGKVTDAASLSFSKSLADGTAVDTADKVWHDSRTVTAAANDDLDLTALTHSIFGSTVTINMARVKVIAIKVVTETTAYGLNLDSSVANGFTGPFQSSATSKVSIGASSVLVLMSAKDGWATSGSNKVLRITNPSAGSVTYQIAVIGTSA